MENSYYVIRFEFESSDIYGYVGYNDCDGGFESTTSFDDAWIFDSAEEAETFYFKHENQLLTSSTFKILNVDVCKVVIVNEQILRLKGE